MKEKENQTRSAPRVPSGLMPNAKLYLLFLVIFAIATLILVRDRWWIAAAEGVVILALIIYALILRRTKRKALLRYLESVTYDTESAMNNTLQNFPLPIAVFGLDDSRIIWGNEMFFKMCGCRSRRFMCAACSSCGQTSISLISAAGASRLWRSA